MRKKLIAFGPWMAMATAVHAQRAPATVVFTYQGTFSDRVERQDKECLVPIALLENWGWKVRSSGSEADISAEGRLLRVSLTGDRKVPLSECVRQLGARGEWDSDRRVYRVVSELRSADILFGQLNISCSLGVAMTSFTLTNPSRYVIDLEGATLAPGSSLTSDPRIKIKAIGASTVRITYQAPDAESLPRLSAFKRLIEIPLEPAAAPISKPSPPKTFQPPVTTDPVVLEAKLTAVDSSGTGRSADVSIQWSGALPSAPRVVRPDGSSIQILFPGVTNALDLPKPQSDLIERWDLTVDPGGNVVLTIQLRQPAVAMFQAGSSNAALNLRVPAAADGTIRGKTICVDAGHGGKDSGTLGETTGLQEKNLALLTAKKLAEKLMDAGCNVIMTRNTDVFIPLTERAEIANRNGADLFISVHYNSASNRSASGIMVFHHGPSSTGKLLALCISGKIGAKGQLANKGPASDMAVAKKSGFSVLRNTTMTGVLLELGFLSNRHDESVVNSDEFRDQISEGVVEGLRMFFGEEMNDGKK